MTVIGIWGTAFKVWTLQSVTKKLDSVDDRWYPAFLTDPLAYVNDRLRCLSFS